MPQYKQYILCKIKHCIRLSERQDNRDCRTVSLVSLVSHTFQYKCKYRVHFLKVMNFIVCCTSETLKVQHTVSCLV